MRGLRGTVPGSWGRRWPVVLAAGLLVLGIIGTAVRLDAPADGSSLPFGASTWQTGAVVVDVPSPTDGGLRTGDEVRAIAGARFADGLGQVPEPAPGDVLRYDLAGDAARSVRVDRPAIGPLVAAGWGDLVFVLALGGLAVALWLRRPDEPATAPLLVAAAGLFGSTMTVVAGLPALALATGGPPLWLYYANTIGAYSIAWGAVLAMTFLVAPGHPWLTRRPGRVLGLAYAGPPAAVAVWAVALLLAVDDPIRRLGLLGAGQTAVTAASLLVGIVAGVVAYRGAADPLTRARLRWIAGGGAVATLTGIVGWSLPELLTGSHPLPPGAYGLSGLPFVVGLAVALRRHRLFDLERLANRSLVYAVVLAVLVGVYVLAVALLASGLRLSDGVAAGLAAALAALALAPLRAGARTAVNRLMYGQRDDPARVLAALGGRLEAALRPGDVAGTVVDTVTRSLRVPFAALDLAEGSGFRTLAATGRPAGAVHEEPLVHLGETVGRLRVSGRGPEDPLDPVDLALLRSLAAQVGPAVLAVRLHEEVLRSRTAIVASREDERRRLRRELHDGIGPSLAAIALKTGLAERQVPQGPARALLGQISGEVQNSIADVRRVVDTLRPPALDELGLVGALTARAAALSGDLEIAVTGPADRPVLPAGVETAAYRIAVEAMTNAARHSGGSRCTVTVTVDEDRVEVGVVDDGSGLPGVRRPGVGLRSMSERAAEIGGTCEVSSPDGAGTSVHALLPLGAPA
ncbi:sensor histidine kinase [Petropleomorpha daqingensis]|uniref:histidine kinase n=1 Tax=Petropleomorpha daqingensis TaxID=2026353 RepID=A0A853CNB2_9ACTN|nr:sensor histidine kinase [Petropleomorpha daqingensis]NYJ08936.1 signal transduction histidine kinase [Petropleomorpha daqingensis]